MAYPLGERNALLYMCNPVDCMCQKCFCVTFDKSNKTPSYAAKGIPYLKDVRTMRRTISAMVGKGSVNHNSRRFIAENVDRERTPQNIEYCNENIQNVYHELFDQAVQEYNFKQKRSDRRIESYYEKIRESRQEKLFHEVIFQVGNLENTAAESAEGKQAKEILDEFMKGFQSRNPYLRVFSAHLHMDEATPHLHIDFVPFMNGSSRGLSTRVSLKQALL